MSNQSSKDLNKEHLIDVARDVFARFGYKKTTVDDIAQKAGKAKSSLYYYFKSKEDIFIAVLEKEATILRSKIVNALVNISNPADQLRTYIITRMVELKNLPNVHVALTEGFLQSGNVGVEFREEYDRKEEEFLKNILQKGASQNIFGINDSEFGAVALASSLKGMEYLLSVNDNQSIKERISAITDILLYGLVKRDM
jgi:AcrR family transcriptional regulator